MASLIQHADNIRPIFDEFDRAFIVHVVKTVLFIWIVLEVGFYVVVRYFLQPKLEKINTPHHHHMNPLVCIKRVFDTIDSLKHMTVEHYLFKFFRESKLEDIYMENFRSFVAWAMFGQHLKDLTSEENDDVNAAISEALSRYPVLRKLSAGYNADVKHAAFNLEPVAYIHRPLMMYVGAGIMEFASNFTMLRICGFQSLDVDGHKYWYRQHGTASTGRCAADTVPPVLILHGISTGWSFYARLIRAFSEDRTVILMDLDAIKVKSMHFDMPTPAQFVDKVLKVLACHRIDKVSVVGHSFGTITAGWLVKAHPEVVSHLTLIDPVSLLLLTGDVAFNFLYRRPSTVVEWAIYLMASREITIATMLHRNFWWYVNALWLEDIPEHIPVVVGVAGGDEISNPRAVHEYVLNCGRARERALQAASSTCTRVATIAGVFWDRYSHGQILMGGAQHTEFIQLVKGSEKAHSAASI